MSTAFLPLFDSIDYFRGVKNDGNMVCGLLAGSGNYSRRV